MIKKEITPLAWSVAEFCDRVGGGIGKTTVYQAIRRGEISISKVGDRTLIEDEEGQRWLRSKRVQRGGRSAAGAGDGVAERLLEGKGS